MKSLILAAALLLGGAVSAYADTDIWTSNPPRSDGELAVAANSCSHQFGAPQNGTPTRAAYKRCMAGLGWKYADTQRNDTWVNHRGMTCHPILNGLGSECSSF